MNTPQPVDHSVDVGAVIDRTLAQLGSARPRPGMQDRILRRLDEALAAPVAAPRVAFFGWPRLAFASLAGCCLCAGVVFGSLQHSHAVAAQNRPIVLVLQQQSGVATASSTHIAAHPAMAPKGGGRSDEHLGSGRATVKPGTHVHGGDGIAVPPIHGSSAVHN